MDSRQGETDMLRQGCIPRHGGRSWQAEGSGQLKQAGRQAGRQTEAGKDRHSQGIVGRQVG
jgi:hypothetical protein